MNIETKLISEGNTFNNVVTGELKDDVLKFTENGIKVEYDLKNNILSRSSSAFDMSYKFKVNEETNNEIYIKDIDKTIDIKYKLVDYYNEIRYIINYGG